MLFSSAHRARCGDLYTHHPLNTAGPRENLHVAPRLRILEACVIRSLVKKHLVGSTPHSRLRSWLLFTISWNGRRRTWIVCFLRALAYVRLQPVGSFSCAHSISVACEYVFGFLRLPAFSCLLKSRIAQFSTLSSHNTHTPLQGIRASPP